MPLAFIVSERLNLSAIGITLPLFAADNFALVSADLGLPLCISDIRSLVSSFAEQPSPPLVMLVKA